MTEAGVNEQKSAQSERARPVRPWLAPLEPVLRWLSSRRNEYGDEKSWGTRWLAFHVSRWGSRTYGRERWYDEWHVLVMWPGGHRSFYLCDIPEDGTR